MTQRSVARLGHTSVQRTNWESSPLAAVCLDKPLTQSKNHSQHWSPSPVSLHSFSHWLKFKKKLSEFSFMD